MLSILIATRNRHKVVEIQATLGAAFHCHALDELPDAPEIAEDGATFAANAERKSRGMAKWLGTRGIGSRWAFVLADDSGLEVDALAGAPGVHSARFAALDTGRPGNSSDLENNAKLLRLLNEVPVEQRRARFRCAMALTPIPGPEGIGREPGPSVLFDGACEGHLELAPRGEGGFGYDPLFIPDGFQESFAELGEAVKNRISHRARALERLRGFLSGCYEPSSARVS